MHELIVLKSLKEAEIKSKNNLCQLSISNDLLRTNKKNSIRLKVTDKNDNIHLKKKIQ